jgi:hypothetical protein
LLTNPNLQQYNKIIKEKSEKAIKLFHAFFIITDPKYRKQKNKLNGKNYHRRLVVNIVGLSNERRRYVSKEHVWRHGNGKIVR